MCIIIIVIIIMAYGLHSRELEGGSFVPTANPDKINRGIARLKQNNICYATNSSQYFFRKRNITPSTNMMGRAIVGNSGMEAGVLPEISVLKKS